VPIRSRLSTPILLAVLSRSSAELQRVWLIEAVKHQVVPLVDRLPCGLSQSTGRLATESAT